jgi:hypothetical protein
LLTYLLQLTGIENIMRTPDGVSAHERYGDDQRLLFLLNYTEAPKIVALDESWKDAFSDEIVREVEIVPIDLRIL